MVKKPDEIKSYHQCVPYKNSFVCAHMRENHGQDLDFWVCDEETRDIPEKTVIEQTGCMPIGSLNVNGGIKTKSNRPMEYPDYYKISPVFVHKLDKIMMKWKTDGIDVTLLDPFTFKTDTMPEPYIESVMIHMARGGLDPKIVIKEFVKRSTSDGFYHPAIWRPTTALMESIQIAAGEKIDPTINQAITEIITTEKKAEMDYADATDAYNAIVEPIREACEANILKATAKLRPQLSAKTQIFNHNLTIRRKMDDDMENFARQRMTASELKRTLTKYVSELRELKRTLTKYVSELR